MTTAVDVRGSKASRLGLNKAAVSRVIGLGLLIAWSDLTFFSKLIHYSTRNSITHLNSVYMYACLGTGAALLAVWAVWRISGQHRARGAGTDRGDPEAEPGRSARLFSVTWLQEHVRALALVAALLLMASTAALCMVEHRWFTQPWCSIFSVAAGAGLGIMYLVWAFEFMRVRRNTLVVQLSLAFLTGGVVYVGVLYLPDFAGMAICALLPIASLPMIGACSEPVSADGVDVDPADGDGFVEVQAIAMRRLKNGYRARTFAALLLVGLAESFERALFVSLNPITERMANHWILLAATAIAAAVIAVAAIVVEGRAKAVFVNRATMFAMAVLFLLAPIVDGVGLLSDLATLTCHFLLYLLLWSMLVKMSGEYRMSVATTFAPGMGLASLGCCAGTLLGSIVMSFTVPDTRAMGAFALACAVLAMIAFTFLLTEQVVVDITNSDAERPSGPRRFELRCREVAATYGLSARETEVMILAAKGRTNQRIQEELGISTGTVNTHFAHIYKKLDVHDRQQMLDMIDGRDVTIGTQ